MHKYVKAYGGSENLEFVTACSTRLRITVADPTKIDKNKISIINGYKKQAQKDGLSLSGFINDTLEKLYE